jgi:uncharacterized protein YciI
VEYLVYGRDRPGALAAKVRVDEEHQSYMDGYADRFVARGPTLVADDEDADPTGSLHILELPGPDAARAFATQEPYYLAGAFGTVEVYEFRNLLGRTMWEFDGAVAGYGRYLLIALDGEAGVPTQSPHLIVGGTLHHPDDGSLVGAAVLGEARDPASAASLLPGATEVHHWRFGGRR